jgi:hypothetical protein
VIRNQSDQRDEMDRNMWLELSRPRLPRLRSDDGSSVRRVGRGVGDENPFWDNVVRAYEELE